MATYWNKRSTFTTCQELVDLLNITIHKLNLYDNNYLHKCTFTSTNYYSDVTYSTNFKLTDNLINKIIGSTIMEINTNHEGLVNKLIDTNTFYTVSKRRNGTKRWTLVRTIPE